MTKSVMRRRHAEVPDIDALTELLKEALAVSREARVDPRLQMLETLDKSSEFSLRITQRKALRFCIWLGLFVGTAVALLLLAFLVALLLWFIRKSSQEAPASELFPAGLFGLLTLIASTLNMLVIRRLWKRTKQ